MDLHAEHSIIRWSSVGGAWWPVVGAVGPVLCVCVCI